MNVRRTLMDVHKIVQTLTVVTIALVVLGILWQLMNMDVMVRALLSFPDVNNILKCETLYPMVLTCKHCMNTDVDECAQNIHDCEHTCENTIGSFLCGCNAGYELTSDGRTCQGMNKSAITAMYSYIGACSINSNNYVCACLTIFMFVAYYEPASTPFDENYN